VSTATQLRSGAWALASTGGLNRTNVLSRAVVEAASGNRDVVSRGRSSGAGAGLVPGATDGHPTTVRLRPQRSRVIAALASTPGGSASISGATPCRGGLGRAQRIAPQSRSGHLGRPQADAPLPVRWPGTPTPRGTPTNRRASQERARRRVRLRRPAADACPARTDATLLSESRFLAWLHDAFRRLLECPGRLQFDADWGVGLATC
jgi:hypothetical protein